MDALRHDIRRGILRFGDRLPAQRELASALGVNLSTISKAYQEASDKRLIAGEVGRGTFVLALSAEDELLRKASRAEKLVDLAANVPAPLPEDGRFLEALAGLTPDEQRELTRYASPALLERSAQAGARWLAPRGLDPQATVIPCVGAHAALMALLIERTEPGDPVVVESFTFPGMKALAKQLRLRLIAVDQDDDGVLPEAFDAAVRRSRARLAVLVPNLHNPTGSVMAEHRRTEIANLVERHGLTVIEDDVYGHFTDAPLLAPRLNGRGIVISSLSKTVMAGLRFGVIASDAAQIASLSSSPHLTDWLTTPMALYLGAHWIESGLAFERVEKQVAEMNARWQIMSEVLGGSPRPPSPHLWLSVRGDPDDVVSESRKRGVAVVSANVFAAGRKSAPRIRVSLMGATSGEELRSALQRLTTLGVHA
ncbi:PLP-dependent aminotransferase family protein [Aurantimonas sp. VKM B-3413]|uniref:aminotransferase-like domain-containing protein n=1 Tax=Aurantimonas sp. VKM B-3413 TaxID=2779401 RepID=UPI001E55D18A